jgi:MoxR-like ATPase
MRPEKEKWWDLFGILAEIYQLPSGRGPLNLGTRRVDAALFFTLLATTLRDNALILGERGTGKTTLARLICSLISGLPFEFFEIAQLRVNPELTLETMIGAPDLGELNQGRIKVIWTNFVKSPYKIIDELFRLPPGKASILLQGLDTGIWTYCGQHLNTGKVPAISAANYADAGSFEVIPPLLDRLQVAVEMGYRGPRHALRVAEGGSIEEKAETLGLNEHLEEAISAAEKPGEEGVKALRALGEEIKKEREKQGIPVLYEAELREMKALIEALPVDQTAREYSQFLISLLSGCPKKGMKRANEPCPSTCEFLDSPCSWVQTGASVRACQALFRYAKAVAWLTGFEKVKLDDFVVVAPYILWHRCAFHSVLKDRFQRDQRSSPWDLFVTQRFVAKVLEIYEREGEAARILLTQGAPESFGVKANEIKNPVLLDIILEVAREGVG